MSLSQAAELSQADRRTGKSEAAFRTISEVAEELDVPQHVLRFWESKFTQIRPLKRGGGRRYYRPEDVVLLRRIRDLLYKDGYTIKGVQKLLRESGGKLAPAEDNRPQVAEAAEEAAPAAGDLFLTGVDALDAAPAAAAPLMIRPCAAQPAAAPQPAAPAELAPARDDGQLRETMQSVLDELIALKKILQQAQK